MLLLVGYKKRVADYRGFRCKCRTEKGLGDQNSQKVVTEQPHYRNIRPLIGQLRFGIGVTGAVASRGVPS